MSSKTKAQARFMAACSHGAGYSSCPPAKVSKDFNQADKGSKLLSSAMKKAEGGRVYDRNLNAQARCVCGGGKVRW